VSTDRLVVFEDRRELGFSFGEMLRFHGGASPGGVAHAFKVLERVLPLLDPASRVERRELSIETAFGGPGGRDGFELVTRAVSDGRYTVEPQMARPELGLARERFVFAVSYRDTAVTVALRAGFVTDEFIALTRQPDRTRDEEQRLSAMKEQMAARVMTAAADEVYEVAC
jgi:hypothetical protein